MSAVKTTAIGNLNVAANATRAGNGATELHIDTATIVAIEGQPASANDRTWSIKALAGKADGSLADLVDDVIVTGNDPGQDAEIVIVEIDAVFQKHILGDGNAVRQFECVAAFRGSFERHLIAKSEGIVPARQNAAAFDDGFARVGVFAKQFERAGTEFA